MELEHLTADWIRRHVDPAVPESATVACERIGVGRGLLGRLYRVSCSSGASFVLKLPPPPGSTWDGFLALMAPFAREAESYRLLADHRAHLGSVLPACYWSTSSADGRGAIALEDLTRREAVMADVAVGLDGAQARAALRALARLHSLFATVDARVDRLRAPHGWMYSPTSASLAAILVEARDQAHRIAARQMRHCFAEHQLAFVASWPVAQVLEQAHRGSRLASILHGDAWSNNMMFVAAPGARSADEITAILLDWQFTMWGNPLMDVAFLLLSSLEPETRRWQTADLLRHYHRELHQATSGAIDYSPEDCRSDFERAFEHGALMSIANLEAFLDGVPEASASRLARRLAEVLSDLEAARRVARWRE